MVDPGPEVPEEACGIPTVVLCPGEAVQAHQTDEWAEVRCLQETTDLYREIGRRWCGA